MPKQVDPVQRRRDVVDAVFRLVVRDGVTAASLRNIAAEAGLSIGSVRHYFDSSEALLEHAAREMAQRVEARIVARLPGLESALAGDDRRAAFAAVLGLVEELLPLDDERRAEAVVWLAFTELSRTTPALRPYAAELLHASRVMALEITRSAGRPDEAAEVLAACVDGVILAAVHDPRGYPPERQRHLVAHQLMLVLGAHDTKES